MRAWAFGAIATVAAAIATGCASPPSDPVVASAPAQGAFVASSRPVPLKNGDFEAEPVPGRDCPPSWGCAAHVNPKSFRFEIASGSKSRGRYLKVTRVLDEPWALVTQWVPATQMVGSRVRFSMSVHGEALEGGAGPLLILQGPSGRELDHRKILLARGPGWQRVSVEIDVVPGTEGVGFGLVLEGGGAVGFDDVEAVLLPREGS